MPGRHANHLGANSLRGGRNNYSAKTLGGNFVEARNEPSYFMKVGKAASDPAWQSTTQLQQLDATGQVLNSFGGGIPEEKSADINYNNIVNFDNRQSEKNWKPLSKSTYGKGKKNEFSTVFKEKPALGNNELNDYRRRWTQETPVMRQARYRTEQTIMMNRTVPSAFTTDVLSSLPGMPKVVEDVRKLILKRSGSDGVRSLTRMLRCFDDSGDGKLSKDEFKWGLMDYGIELEPTHYDELFNAFDRDRNGFIDFTEFLAVIRGPMSTPRLNVVGKAFSKLDKTGDGIISVEDLLNTFDASKHPSVLSGSLSEKDVLANMTTVWEGATGNHDGQVTKSEFADYYRDMSNSMDSDDEFIQMVQNAWNLSNDERKV